MVEPGQQQRQIADWWNKRDPRAKVGLVVGALLILWAIFGGSTGDWFRIGTGQTTTSLITTTTATSTTTDETSTTATTIAP